jgi:hypothetical protein
MALQVIRDGLMLCIDCMITAVNGHVDDITPERERAVAAGLDALGPDLAPDFGEGDGEDEFSWRPCACCKTSLGGSRYRFAVLGPVSDPLTH